MQIHYLIIIQYQPMQITNISNKFKNNKKLYNNNNKNKMNKLLKCLIF